jgi:hypothetical protein
VKLNFDVTIVANLDAVWDAFDNPDNKVRWQTNFHSYEHRTGIPGQPGATAELTFDEKGKMVVLTETITERRDRSFLAGTYESVHGTTVIFNRFEEINGQQTHWHSWRRISFNGMMKVMLLFIGGTIRKRTEADMQRFKLMVETDEAQSL